MIYFFSWCLHSWRVIIHFTRTLTPPSKTLLLHNAHKRFSGVMPYIMKANDIVHWTSKVRLKVQYTKKLFSWLKEEEWSGLLCTVLIKQVEEKIWYCIVILFNKSQPTMYLMWDYTFSSIGQIKVLFIKDFMSVDNRTQYRNHP